MKLNRSYRVYIFLYAVLVQAPVSLISGPDLSIAQQPLKDHGRKLKGSFLHITGARNTPCKDKILLSIPSTNLSSAQIYIRILFTRFTPPPIKKMPATAPKVRLEPMVPRPLIATHHVPLSMRPSNGLTRILNVTSTSLFGLVTRHGTIMMRSSHGARDKSWTRIAV